MTREELLNELQEQARLVGMGAERELALMAKVDRLERMNAELLEALDLLLRYSLSHPIHTDQSQFGNVYDKARAAIAKARGEK